MKCVFFILIFFIFGCRLNNEKDRALRELPNAYCLDTSRTEKNILKFIACDTLKLILKKDLTYEFYPKLEILKELEGEWNLSDDYEMSFWVFKMKNGKTQYNYLLGINLSDEKYSTDSMIRFDKTDSSFLSK